MKIMKKLNNCKVIEFLTRNTYPFFKINMTTKYNKKSFWTYFRSKPTIDNKEYKKNYTYPRDRTYSEILAKLDINKIPLKLFESKETFKEQKILFLASIFFISISGVVIFLTPLGLFIKGVNALFLIASIRIAVDYLFHISIFVRSIHLTDPLTLKIKDIYDKEYNIRIEDLISMRSKLTSSDNKDLAFNTKQFYIISVKGYKRLFYLSKDNSLLDLALFYDIINNTYLVS
jgi:hypothetical protein